MMSALVALHTLAAVIWVGGMFFAYLVLRPATAELLDVPMRVMLWRYVFRRFFPWVWAAIIALLASGYGIIFMELGGMGNAGWHIHAMQMLGIVMMLLFLHLFFAPYRRLIKTVNEGYFETALRSLNQIRVIIGINLALGLAVVVIATAGRFL